MPSDTFIGSVSNPTEACGDVVGVTAIDFSNAANHVALVENGTVNFNYTPIVIDASVKNTGQLTGSFTVTLYIDNVQKEQKTTNIDAGVTTDVIFNNANVGYPSLDGETHEYKVTVTP